MSRIVMELLREMGGEADARDLNARYYNSQARLANLVRQGYVERVRPGRYRLTEAARGD